MSTPAPLSPGLFKERYGLIDAFRGLAALAVVVHHAGADLTEATHGVGNPAVVVFFVISGYCIAAAADACARKNMSFGQFMWRRLRRIYPPYLLGLCFYTLTRLVKWKLEGKNDLARPITDWVQNITLTQWVSLVPNPMNEAPMNPKLFVAAFWSLCYEEQFYLVFGALLTLAVWRKWSILKGVIALLVLSLAWIALFPKTCHGLFIEYWAMFSVGSLVFYRLCRLQNSKARLAVDFGIGAIMLLGIAMKIAYTAPDRVMHLREWFAPEVRVAWGDVAVSSAFALLLIALRRADDLYAKARAISIPLGLLGLITYSLYLIHQFNLTLVSKVVDKALGIVGISTPPVWFELAARCTLHVVIAAGFWFLCERPFLNTKPQFVPVKNN